MFILFSHLPSYIPPSSLGLRQRLWLRSHIMAIKKLFVCAPLIFRAHPLNSRMIFATYWAESQLCWSEEWNIYRKRLFYSRQKFVTTCRWVKANREEHFEKAHWPYRHESFSSMLSNCLLSFRQCLQDPMVTMQQSLLLIGPFDHECLNHSCPDRTGLISKPSKSSSDDPNVPTGFNHPNLVN